MTDVNPNRWGEPMNRPKGTLAPSGRGGGQIGGISVVNGRTVLICDNPGCIARAAVYLRRGSM
jgi:hypothetical protein